MLDSLCQGEGLAGTIGPNDEDGRKVDRDGCGDGQNGFFLLGIQTRIQLLVPLPKSRSSHLQVLDIHAHEQGITLNIIDSLII